GAPALGAARPTPATGLAASRLPTAVRAGGARRRSTGVWAVRCCLSPGWSSPCSPFARPPSRPRLPRCAHRPRLARLARPARPASILRVTPAERRTDGRPRQPGPGPTVGGETERGGKDGAGQARAGAVRRGG